jgi:hypothetical protein
VQTVIRSLALVAIASLSTSTGCSGGGRGHATAERNLVDGDARALRVLDRALAGAVLTVVLQPRGWSEAGAWIGGALGMLGGPSLTRPGGDHWLGVVTSAWPEAEGALVAVDHDAPAVFSLAVSEAGLRCRGVIPSTDPDATASAMVSWLEGLGLERGEGAATHVTAMSGGGMGVSVRRGAEWASIDLLTHLAVDDAASAIARMDREVEPAQRGRRPLDRALVSSDALVAIEVVPGHLPALVALLAAGSAEAASRIASDPEAAVAIRLHSIALMTRLVGTMLDFDADVDVDVWGFGIVPAGDELRLWGLGLLTQAGRRFLEAGRAEARSPLSPERGAASVGVSISFHPAGAMQTRDSMALPENLSEYFDECGSLCAAHAVLAAPLRLATSILSHGHDLRALSGVWGPKGGSAFAAVVSSADAGRFEQVVLGQLPPEMRWRWHDDDAVRVALIGDGLDPASAFGSSRALGQEVFAELSLDAHALGPARTMVSALDRLHIRLGAAGGVMWLDARSRRHGDASPPELAYVLGSPPRAPADLGETRARACLRRAIARSADELSRLASGPLDQVVPGAAALADGIASDLVCARDQGVTRRLAAIVEGSVMGIAGGGDASR